MDRRLPVERIERYDSEDGIHVKKWTVCELIRCKDCKSYDEAERMCNDTNGFDRYWKPTDFCSYGKRRTDDDRSGNGDNRTV